MCVWAVDGEENLRAHRLGRVDPDDDGIRDNVRLTLSLGFVLLGR